ncbi:cysteine--tRNA ligase [Mycetocola reblochoni]|uniref:Cysteine--tRNA ligase n=2 Tax=Mycetocola reblochoni TaxID=331618 RepID=A0A1R4JQL4_9MICO|nr:cysteine--tRNA ligase [Mycetocola reblochoni]RLP69308.1 cysteine--tRNA ligase [Mycetocola reblochoni]SJN34287.1 Cysteinyl-tRNA synthetase [Mycetocola reblochoni REB411]
MALRLYDSRAQRLEDFTPLIPGEARVYVCGPTVQSSPHIGHLRSALVYDQLRRWLGESGLRVVLVRNVTDIDDKVLVNAVPPEPWWALAYRTELEFTSAYNRLGILPPSYEPRATASIPQMQELIVRLIDRGHAYVAEDGSGDVYFEVRSWPQYGALTHQSVEQMADAADGEPRAKRDPADFALWKGRKQGEPDSAVWESPWGEGRPGWHIECSAMSLRYLGESFDIHGGGLDLRFPHHENELAQSTAAGLEFARLWMHNGLVTVDGQKMSKSLGNSVFAADMLAAARPIVVRYLLGQAHYRSTIDVHDGSLDEAAAAVERIESFLDRAARRLDGTRFAAEAEEVALPDAFVAAMDDDLAVPQALGVLHETIRAGNAAVDADDPSAVAVALGAVRRMTGVLGIDPAADTWSEAGADPARAALETLVESLLAARVTARADRDFTTADRIRNDLAAAGVRIEDTPSGAHWSIDGQ